MIIEHVSLWVRDLEAISEFYCDYFGGNVSESYVAAHDQFRSCFITFSCGARLELMTRSGLAEPPSFDFLYGWAHVAFSLGSKAKVDETTQRLKLAGCHILSGPRVTGDGYYESSLLDPEGNVIEITI